MTCSARRWPPSWCAPSAGRMPDRPARFQRLRRAGRGSCRTRCASSPRLRRPRRRRDLRSPGLRRRALRADRPGQPGPGHRAHRARLQPDPAHAWAPAPPGCVPPAGTPAVYAAGSAPRRQRRGHPRRADDPGGLGRARLARLGGHGALAGAAVRAVRGPAATTTRAPPWLLAAGAAGVRRAVRARPGRRAPGCSHAPPPRSLTSPAGTRRATPPVGGGRDDAGRAAAALPARDAALAARAAGAEPAGLGAATSAPPQDGGAVGSRARYAISPQYRARLAALLAPHLATPEGEAFVQSLGRGEAPAA